MPELPRLVIASVSEPEEPSACTVALMAALQNRGYHVQHFRSVAAFTPIDYVTPLTGIASRHLDPWIMSTSLCRELFVRSASQADVSIIEGCSKTGCGNPGCGNQEVTGGSNWRQVARMLNSPVVGVFRSQPNGLFHAQRLPEGIDALLIDGFSSREHYEVEKASLEGLFGKPVVGGLADGHPAGECIAKMQLRRRVPGAMLEELTRRLLAVTNLDDLLELSRYRPFPAVDTNPKRQREDDAERTSLTLRLSAPPAARRSLRVAIAYDDCFHCYFPDTLDALEFLGAELCEFSPLVDERLPEGTDIVYLGCGHPEDHAQALAENECMRASLHEHVCAGQRIYAEGGGTAYLCQQIRLLDGSVVPMVGIFAAEAQFVGRSERRPQPVVLNCGRTTWISALGDTIRGYRNGVWRLVPKPGLRGCFASDSNDPEGVVRHHCVGSTVHLNFAAQPRVLESFFAPHAPSLSIC